MEYTARLERARINKMPRLRSVTGRGIGIGAHRVMARVKASMGVARNRKGEDADGRMGSLMKSLTPSAMGCRRP